MLAELTPEFPSRLRDQVSCLLTMHYPEVLPEYKIAVRACIEQLEDHPFGERLSTSIRTLRNVVSCTIELVGDAVLKQKIALHEIGVPIPVGRWLAEHIIIPSVEKETLESFENKLTQGENPFIPKPVEPPPVVINHHVIRNRLEMCMN